MTSLGGMARRHRTASTMVMPFPLPQIAHVRMTRIPKRYDQPVPAWPSRYFTFCYGETGYLCPWISRIRALDTSTWIKTHSRRLSSASSMFQLSYMAWSGLEDASASLGSAVQHLNAQNKIIGMSMKGMYLVRRNMTLMTFHCEGQTSVTSSAKVKR